MSIRVLSPGDDGPVTQTNATPSAARPDGRPSSEPSWLWVWTFTWCEETTDITTVAGADTGLEWLWNWSWNWACDGAVPGDTNPDTDPDTDPNPDTAPTPPGQGAPPVQGAPPHQGSGSGAAPTTSAPTMPAEAADTTFDSAISPTSSDVESLFPAAWPFVNVELSAWPSMPNPLFPVLPGPAPAAAWPPAPVRPSVKATVEVTIPAIVVAVPPPPAPPSVEIDATDGMVEISVEIDTASTPSARPRPDAHRTKSSRPPTRALARPVSSAVSTTSPSAPSGHQKAESSRNATGPSAGSSGDSGRGPLPFDLPPLQATSSSASVGGSTPSLLVFGVAAIIGFFVFAAPGLGWRIRLARLPSPRGRYGSSIDRPG